MALGKIPVEIKALRRDLESRFSRLGLSFSYVNGNAWDARYSGAKALKSMGILHRVGIRAKYLNSWEFEVYLLPNSSTPNVIHFSGLDSKKIDLNDPNSLDLVFQNFGEILAKFEGMDCYASILSDWPNG